MKVSYSCYNIAYEQSIVQRSSDMYQMSVSDVMCVYPVTILSLCSFHECLSNVQPFCSAVHMLCRTMCSSCANELLHSYRAFPCATYCCHGHDKAEVTGCAHTTCLHSSRGTLSNSVYCAYRAWMKLNMLFHETEYQSRAMCLSNIAPSTSLPDGTCSMKADWIRDSMSSLLCRQTLVCCSACQETHQRARRKKGCDV